MQRLNSNPLIVHLCENPSVIPELICWFEQEWAPWYGPGGEGDAGQDLESCSNTDVLPLCLVALGPDNRLIGTVALRTTSVGSDVAPGPWLTGLLVAEECRGQGVASALTAALEEEARRLGFEALYTSTDAADGIMRRRGWQPVGTSASLRGEVTVFRCGVAT